MGTLVSKASILGALSQMLDLVEGQASGHALRTFLIAARICKELKLYSEEIEDTYFSSVLKDAGCSNNSVRIRQIFGGDELISKRQVKFVDWSSPYESFKFAIENTERGGPLKAKLLRLAQNIGSPAAIMNDVTKARCTRGSFIAKELHLGGMVSNAILYVDEHWDGRGSPYGLVADEIPLIARIVCVAQTFDVFFAAFGLAAAREVIEKRSGKWFDPELVKICLGISAYDPLWKRLESDNLNYAANQEVPWLATAAGEVELDDICRAFAMIIDAKSEYTDGHSNRVAQYAQTLGAWFGFNEAEVLNLNRACLMHNIGSLGVSNCIIESPVEPTIQEFEVIKAGLRNSERILSTIVPFETVAEVASGHQERVDGLGYWKGLTKDQLTLEVRIASVCRTFDQLTSKQPFREAMHFERAAGFLEREAGSALDPVCVHGMIECLHKVGEPAPEISVGSPDALQFHLS